MKSFLSRGNRECKASDGGELGIFRETKGLQKESGEPGKRQIKAGLSTSY